MQSASHIGEVECRECADTDAPYAEDWDPSHCLLARHAHEAELWVLERGCEACLTVIVGWMDGCVSCLACPVLVLLLLLLLGPIWSIP